MGELEDLTDMRIETERRQAFKWKRPEQIIIETSAACQLRCVGCPINHDSGKGFMSFNDVKSILDRIDFKTTIIPWMNGEPLLHPEYAKILKEIVSKGFRAYITTNGMIWDEEVMQIMAADNSIYQVIFSLDGYFGISQERVRPGSDYHRIVKNILRFRDLVVENGGRTDVAVKICRRGQDQAEVERYISWWLREVDYVCEGKMLDNDNAPLVRSTPCKYPDSKFMVIRADGRMVPCAYNNAVVNGNHFHWPNVFADRKAPIIAYYNDPILRQWRSDQDSGIFHGPCRTCGFAYTGEGFQGTIEFRDRTLDVRQAIYWHNDYYNQFYSLKKKWK